MSHLPRLIIWVLCAALVVSLLPLVIYLCAHDALEVAVISV